MDEIMEWQTGLHISQPEPVGRVQDRDSAIQVWCEGELIGTLWHTGSIRGREISVATEHNISPTSFGIETMRLSVTKRSAVIDEYEIAIARNPDFAIEHFKEAHNIPLNATQERNAMANTRIFSWLVLDITLDESEKLFDVDDFHPIS